jgi:hypothetical protein
MSKADSGPSTAAPASKSRRAVILGAGGTLTPWTPTIVERLTRLSGVAELLLEIAKGLNGKHPDLGLELLARVVEEEKGALWHTLELLKIDFGGPCPDQGPLPDQNGGANV